MPPARGVLSDGSPAYIAPKARLLVIRRGLRKPTSGHTWEPCTPPSKAVCFAESLGRDARPSQPLTARPSAVRPNRLQPLARLLVKDPLRRPDPDDVEAMFADATYPTERRGQAERRGVTFAQALPDVRSDGADDSRPAKPQGLSGKVSTASTRRWSPDLQTKLQQGRCAHLSSALGAHSWPMRGVDHFTEHGATRVRATERGL